MCEFLGTFVEPAGVQPPCAGIKDSRKSAKRNLRGFIGWEVLMGAGVDFYTKDRQTAILLFGNLKFQLFPKIFLSTESLVKRIPADSDTESCTVQIFSWIF